MEKLYLWLANGCLDTNHPIIITTPWSPKLFKKSMRPKAVAILPRVLEWAIVLWKFRDEGFHSMLKGSSEMGFGSMGGLMSQEMDLLKCEGSVSGFWQSCHKYISSLRDRHKEGRERGRGRGRKAHSPLPFSLPLPLSLSFWRLPRSLIHTLMTTWGHKKARERGRGGEGEKSAFPSPSSPLLLSLSLSLPSPSDACLAV